MRRCCERGLTTFDLGIGQATYKTLFCPDAEPLFDSHLPLTSAGRMLAVGFGVTARCKRAVKSSAALWSLARALRRLRAVFSPAI